MSLHQTFTKSKEFDGPLIMDGGMATELQSTHGKNLSTDLYSSEYLYKDPNAIRNVHLSYFRAGADICLTCSYQAWVAGFIKNGFSEDQAKELMLRSIQLASEARDTFWSEYLSNNDSINNNSKKRIKPLIALSIGPYGATLANGSEYTGDYGTISDEELREFHESRLRVYRSEFSRVDFIAFETVPSLHEAKIICQVLSNMEKDESLPPCWISFSCKDGTRISHGELIVKCVEAICSSKANSLVFGIGVNCTNPKFIAQLIQKIRQTLDLFNDNKWVLCYPNGGNEWDPVTNDWDINSGVSADVFAEYARKWVKNDSKVAVGGCCKTTPEYIEKIRNQIFE
ncbi:9188_t:CDS:2 [Ambispora gerdemannii]|uniref:9188_t:CDS:1 n=1 Tax=Ambispora gerdemannii TaxID=144530 RepID=A0A9N8ZBC8_9GLOM|nr:9188_t:CDS:2 [Ambispora gerdemannii]